MCIQPKHEGCLTGPKEKMNGSLIKWSSPVMIKELGELKDCITNLLGFCFRAWKSMVFPYLSGNYSMRELCREAEGGLGTTNVENGSCRYSPRKNVIQITGQLQLNERDKYSWISRVGFFTNCNTNFY
jgi:hypothetical protein